MTLPTFESITKKFSGIRYLELHGEGEPLLSPIFFNMVELIKQRIPIF